MSGIHVISLAVALAAFAPGSAAASSAGTGADGDKVVCRSEVPTGSLVTRRKICRPQSEWSNHRRENAPRYYENKLQLASPSEAQRVEVGKANWAKFPKLKSREAHLPYSQLVAMVEEMLRKGACTLPGQSPRAFDIEVPFAIQLGAEGEASRVLVSAMNCEPLETLVGSTALAQAKRGDFKPSAQSKPGWYSGKINFTLM
jgi:hypothetical protein